MWLDAFSLLRTLLTPSGTYFQPAWTAFMRESASQPCIPQYLRDEVEFDNDHNKVFHIVQRLSLLQPPVRSNKSSFDDLRGRRSVLAPTQFSSQFVGL